MRRLSGVSVRGCVAWRRSGHRHHVTSSSVNAEEISKFGKIGTSWWDESSKAGAGPLHALNPVRVDFIRQQIAKEFHREQSHPLDVLRDLTILDAGCGGGLLSEALARLGAKVTAIDPSPENIAVASAHAARDPLTSKTEYVNTTVEDMLASGRKFDVVCSLEVVEHVMNPSGFVSACASLVRPGGSLFLSTMNRTVKSGLLTVAAAEYILRVVPPGTHDWKQYLSPDELAGMVTPIATHVRSSGLVLRPPTSLASLCSRGPLGTWALDDKDLDVNYISHFRRPLTEESSPPSPQ